MGKPNSQFEKLAHDAAERIEAVRAAGEQLTFLPDEAAPGDRAKRGKGKVTSQLRDWCVARGLRLPEEVLIEMAGMASTEDAFLTAMARTEQLLAWAEAGAAAYKGSPAKPSLPQRLATFQFVFTAQLRAAEALLPYGLTKQTPDAAPVQAVQIVMPGAAAPAAVPSGPNFARDVTPKPGRITPPPMPHEIEHNQDLSKLPSEKSDAENRTE